MLLLDENQEVLTLVTNSLKKFELRGETRKSSADAVLATSIIRINMSLDSPFALSATSPLSRCLETCSLKLKT